MFEHLKKLDVSESTAWIDLPEIAPEARILVRPSGQSNRRYWNAFLGLLTKRQRAVMKTPAAKMQLIRESRDHNRRLFPKYVFVKWEGIEDTEGNEVEFSVDHAIELCKSLPDWLFDHITGFCDEPQNFVEDEDELPLDGEELAKN